MGDERQTDSQASLSTIREAIQLADKSHETLAALARAKNESDVATAIITTDIKYIKDDIGEIKNSLRSMKDDFVTHTEFVESMKTLKEQIKPLKSIVYGLVGTVLLAVLYAVLTIVINR